MRIRITFAKTGAMRYTSHLDLHRTWERTFRRAGLPLAYSHGYNPRPKLHLASALPLGFTSQYEIADVWLDESLPISQMEGKIQNAAPPGIIVKSIQEIDPHAPKLPNLLNSAEYIATLLYSVENLDKQIASLLEAEELRRTRRGKEYDLRPLIESLESLQPDAEGHQRLHMRLAARPGATGRPDELLKALDILPHKARVTRVSLNFRDANKNRGS